MMPVTAYWFARGVRVLENVRHEPTCALRGGRCLHWLRVCGLEAVARCGSDARNCNNPRRRPGSVSSVPAGVPLDRVQVAARMRMTRLAALLGRLYARNRSSPAPPPGRQGAGSLSELFETLVHEAVERGAG